jgi:plastocyanin
MLFLRAPKKVVVAVASVAALGGGLAAGGALGAAPTTATVDAVDYGFTVQGGGGNTSTIALGGTVDFRYPTGADEHNVRFTRDGVACTQTDGVGGATNSKVVPEIPEEQGWAGRCTFSQAGTFQFICDIPEHDMKGSIVVVDERPATTDTGTTTTGTQTAPAPAGPGTTPTTPTTTTPVVPKAPTTSVPPAPVVKVARAQKGTALHGTITKGGNRSKVVVDVRATRGSVKAPGRKTSLVSVGKATTRTSATGRLSFAIKLDARARAALKKSRKLTLDTRVTITLPVIGAQSETFRVVLRPATAAKATAKAAVSLKAIKFTPASVTIRKGGTVTWTWRDGDIPHDVVGSGFRSQVVAKGTFKHKFTKAGTFRYVCSIHAKMRGKVTVR